MAKVKKDTKKETVQHDPNDSKFLSGSGKFNFETALERLDASDLSSFDKKVMKRRMNKIKESVGDGSIDIDKTEDGSLRWRWQEGDLDSKRKAGVADDDRAKTGFGGKGLLGLSGKGYDEALDFMVSQGAVDFSDAKITPDQITDKINVTDTDPTDLSEQLEIIDSVVNPKAGTTQTGTTGTKTDTGTNTKPATQTADTKTKKVNPTEFAVQDDSLEVWNALQGMSEDKRKSLSGVYRHKDLGTIFETDGAYRTATQSILGTPANLGDNMIGLRDMDYVSNEGKSDSYRDDEGNWYRKNGNKWEKRTGKGASHSFSAGPASVYTSSPDIWGIVPGAEGEESLASGKYFQSKFIPKGGTKSPATSKSEQYLKELEATRNDPPGSVRAGDAQFFKQEYQRDVLDKINPEERAPDDGYPIPYRANPTPPKFIMYRGGGKISSIKPKVTTTKLATGGTIPKHFLGAVLGAAKGIGSALGIAKNVGTAVGAVAGGTTAETDGAVPAMPVAGGSEGTLNQVDLDAIANLVKKGGKSTGGNLMNGLMSNAGTIASSFLGEGGEIEKGANGLKKLNPMGIELPKIDAVTAPKALPKVNTGNWNTAKTPGSFNTVTAPEGGADKGKTKMGNTITNLGKGINVADLAQIWGSKPVSVQAPNKPLLKAPVIAQPKVEGLSFDDEARMRKNATETNYINTNSSDPNVQAAVAKGKAEQSRNIADSFNDANATTTQQNRNIARDVGAKNTLAQIQTENQNAGITYENDMMKAQGDLQNQLAKKKWITDSIQRFSDRGETNANFSNTAIENAQAEISDLQQHRLTLLQSGDKAGAAALTEQINAKSVNINDLNNQKSTHGSLYNLFKRNG